MVTLAAIVFLVAAVGLLAVAYMPLVSEPPTPPVLHFRVRRVTCSRCGHDELEYTPAGSPDFCICSLLRYDYSQGDES